MEIWSYQSIELRGQGIQNSVILLDIFFIDMILIFFHLSQCQTFLQLSNDFFAKLLSVWQ